MKVNWKQVAKEAVIMAVGWYVFWFFALGGYCLVWGV